MPQSITAPRRGLHQEASPLARRRSWRGAAATDQRERNDREDGDRRGDRKQIEHQGGRPGARVEDREESEPQDDDRQHEQQYDDRVGLHDMPPLATARTRRAAAATITSDRMTG